MFLSIIFLLIITIPHKLFCFSSDAFVSLPHDKISSESQRNDAISSEIRDKMKFQQNPKSNIMKLSQNPKYDENHRRIKISSETEYSADLIKYSLK